MRIISCKIENFGKLQQISYDFTEGLNVISAENGAGKSTLAAFIRVMLYGFENEKKRDAYENERHRFEPWQGGTYGGALTFEADGVSYVVRRTFGKKEKEDTFELREAATNLISTRYSERLGEELFQIDSRSFMRTVFITQNDCETGATDAVNAKIGNLSDSIDDMNRFEAADAKLRDLQNAMSPRRKTGTLARMKEEISLLTEETGQLATVRTAQEELEKKQEEKRTQLAQLKEKREALETQQKALGRYKDAKAKTDSYRVLEARAAECRQRRDAERAVFGETVPTEEQLEHCMQSCIRLSGEMRLAAADAFTSEEEETLRKLQAQFADTPQPEEALQECARLIGEQETKQQEIVKAERLLAEMRERLAKQKEAAVLRREEHEQLRRLEEEQKRSVQKKYRMQICKVAIAAVLLLIPGVVLRTTDWGGRAVSGTGMCVIFVICLIAFAGALVCVIWIVFHICAKRRSDMREKSEDTVTADDRTEEEAETGAVTVIAKLQEQLAADRQAAQMTKQQIQAVFENLHIGLQEQSAAETLHTLRMRYAELCALNTKQERSLAQKEVCRSLQEKLQEEAMTLLKGCQTQCREAVSAGDGDSVAPQFKEPETLLFEIRRRQQELQQYKRTCAELQRAEEALAQFAGSGDMERLQQIVADYESRPAYERHSPAEESMPTGQQYENEAADRPSMEDIGSMLAGISEQTDAARKSLAGYERQQEQLMQREEALAERKEQLETLRTEYKNETEKYRLLTQTREFLTQAKTSLTARYMEPLTTGFAKYYRLLTGQTAERYLLDADINLTVEGYGAQHEARFLSAGYRDLTGLCLRMALLDAMYREEKPALIFDDPFVNLDSEKQKRGQAFLTEIAQEYQVIYFTCS